MGLDPPSGTGSGHHAGRRRQPLPRAAQGPGRPGPDLAPAHRTGRGTAGAAQAARLQAADADFSRGGQQRRALCAERGSAMSLQGLISSCLGERDALALARETSGRWQAWLQPISADTPVGGVCAPGHSGLAMWSTAGLDAECGHQFAELAGACPVGHRA
ncbi:hypothetical protein EMIT0P258_40328 [Pseudomonas sp. IT-P258]